MSPLRTSGEKALQSHESDHPDLISLRLWLDHLYRDLEANTRISTRERRKHRRRLEAIRRAHAPSAPGSGSKDEVRALIATGMVYRVHCHERIRDASLPEALILDFVVDALWPIVIARELPASWMIDLSSISSPELAQAVSRTRAMSGVDSFAQKRHFYERLSRTRVAIGVMNLLEDLGDPRGGGPFVCTLAEVDGMPSTRGLTPEALFRWTMIGVGGGGAAAVAGIIGNRSDALFVEVWRSITDAADAGRAGHSGGSADDCGVGQGGGGHRRGSSVDDIVDAITGHH